MTGPGTAPRGDRPARLALHPDLRVGPVRRRTFGAFVEHMGRGVHTGIHEPGHPRADALGLRTDVIDLVRELGVSTVRYPGGNFVSGYDWEDGVGPLEQRPRRLDLAWHSTEPNTVGLHEFMAFTRAAQVEPMMALNLGTRGMREAIELFTYCMMPTGTALADRRAANGDPEPFRIPIWCLGNEMDGPWQIGHRPAAEYGQLAARTSRALKLIDPDILTVACGSSGPGMPQAGAWEDAVLGAGQGTVDMISAHLYAQEHGDDAPSYLASAHTLDSYLEAIIATADAVTARCDGIGPHRASAHAPTMISVDEWNVTRPDATSLAPSGDDWPVAPRISEARYTALDAVVLGNLLISLLRHTDRVASASLAQLVNVLAPIMTEPGGPAWRQSIFHPFALTSRHARGDVLRVGIDAPAYRNAEQGSSPVIDAVATWEEGTGDLVVIAVNRRRRAIQEITADLRAFGPMQVVAADLVHHLDPTAANTREAPETVVPQPAPEGTVRIEGDQLRWSMPGPAWGIVRLRRAAG